MIQFISGTAVGAVLGGIASGFFWAQFIYTNTKKHKEE